MVDIQIWFETDKMQEFALLSVIHPNLTILSSDGYPSWNRLLSASLPHNVNQFKSIFLSMNEWRTCIREQP